MTATEGWMRRPNGSPFARVAVDVGGDFADEVGRLRLEAMSRWLSQHPQIEWSPEQLAELAAEIGDEAAARRALEEPVPACRRAEPSSPNVGAAAVESEVPGWTSLAAPGLAIRPSEVAISRRASPREPVATSRNRKAKP